MTARRTILTKEIICHDCGKPATVAKSRKIRLCDGCYNERYKNSTQYLERCDTLRSKSKRLCAECCKIYSGTDADSYCPACRAEKASGWARYSVLNDEFNYRKVE